MRKTGIPNSYPAILLAYLCSAMAFADNIAQMSIEDLMAREVTSVSRSTQKLVDSAAAVFVIGAEDIRRSGVTSLPEVFRMVPGMHVARLNANEWAITIRGFNGLFANKLLVLVDGRSAYTPISSGIFWETMDLPLTDIERIEVIRGPGASLWGANAVNGIINIITRNARDTQGGMLDLALGDEEQTVAELRYGSALGEDLYARVYSRYARRDGAVDISGEDAGDDWDLLRGGFRLDWLPTDSNRLMIQGDLYDTNMQRNFLFADVSDNGSRQVLDQADSSGRHLLGRWEHSLSLSSRATTQFYYQRERQDSEFQTYTLDTADFDFQYETALDERQALIWGLGYRYYRDDFDQATQLRMNPERRNYRLISGFVQDQVRLFNEHLEITLGAKVEHNTFTAWEIQPSLRALWQPAAEQRVWVALSRATRTPSRGEQDSLIETIGIPAAEERPAALVFVQGNRDFDSEQVIAFELGYRFWPTEEVYFDVTGFYNDYKDLRFGVLDAGNIELEDEVANVPVLILNGEQGRTYGFELAADWNPYPGLRWQLSYGFLRSDFRFTDEFRDSATFPEGLGDERSPRHQLSLRTSMELSQDIELDLWLRYVDEIPDIQVATPLGVGSVDDYLTLDMRLGWRLSDGLDLSLVGRNLIDVPHGEFQKEINSFPAQVERSVYGRLQWRF